MLGKGAYLLLLLPFSLFLSLSLLLSIHAPSQCWQINTTVTSVYINIYSNKKKENHMYYSMVFRIDFLGKVYFAAWCCIISWILTRVATSMIHVTLFCLLNSNPKKRNLVRRHVQCHVIFFLILHITLGFWTLCI